MCQRAPLHGRLQPLPAMTILFFQGLLLCGGLLMLSHHLSFLHIIRLHAGVYNRACSAGTGNRPAWLCHMRNLLLLPANAPSHGQHFEVTFFLRENSHSLARCPVSCGGEGLAFVCFHNSLCALKDCSAHTVRGEATLEGRGAASVRKAVRHQVAQALQAGEASS